MTGPGGRFWGLVRGRYGKESIRQPTQGRRWLPVHSSKERSRWQEYSGSICPWAADQAGSQTPLRFRLIVTDPSPLNPQTQTLLCNFLETQRPLQSIPRAGPITLAPQYRKFPLLLTYPSAEEPQPPDIDQRKENLDGQWASSIPLFLALCPGSGTKSTVSRSAVSRSLRPHGLWPTRTLCP